ncbi:hypothetical protein MTO96_042571 [Rhipicephalus appendiculatus]
MYGAYSTGGPPAVIHGSRKAFISGSEPAFRELHKAMKQYEFGESLEYSLVIPYKDALGRSRKTLCGQEFLKQVVYCEAVHAASTSLPLKAGGGVREKHATDALGYMIVHDDLPLSTPEKDGFKTFVKALQPLYKPPTEPTITRSLEAKYEELRAHIARRIQAADHLSITADLWTHESTMRSYLGLTVHFREGK